MVQSRRESTTRTGPGIEIFFLLLSTVLGGFAIWLSSWDPLWTSIGITNIELRSSLGAALSIVVLLAGFLPAIYLQSNRLREDTARECQRVVDRIVALVPQLASLEIVTSSAAYDYLANNLPRARCVWNTRISGVGVSPRYDSASAKRYRESLVKTIAAGLEFNEVVSVAWAEDAERLRQQVQRRRAKHYYEYSILQGDVPPILNFIVIHYPDGKREVVSGWVNSRTRGYEQPSVVFRDSRLVDYFQSWYDELQREAEGSTTRVAPTDPAQRDPGIG